MSPTKPYASPVRSCCRSLDAVLTTGRGSIMTDTRGREYIDFLAGAGALTGRSNVISFTRGFHGVSLGSLAATANSGHRMALTNSLPDVSRLPFDGYFGDDIDTARVALEKFWSDDRLSTSVAAHGVEVTRKLLQMARFVPGAQLKGRGMMQGLDVGSGELAAEIRGRCVPNGLIIESSGPHDEVLKVLAPLTTPDHILSEGLGILAEAVFASSDPAEHFQSP